MSGSISEMPVRVRSLQPEDRGQWQALYMGYADFYGVEMAEETLNRVWSWIFDPNNPFYGLVAQRSDGQLVGLMHFRAMPSPLRGAVVGFLDDLYVDPQSRGLGTVDALFEELKLQAREYGWPFVRWITGDDNYRARSVYDRLAEKTGWVTYQLDTGER